MRMERKGKCRKLTIAEPIGDVVLLNATGAFNEEALGPLAIKLAPLHPLSPLLLERPRRAEKCLTLEVVEHDNVGARSDGLAGLIERLALDFDAKGEARDGAGGGNGLRDGA